MFRLWHDAKIRHSSKHSRKLYIGRMKKHIFRGLPLLVVLCGWQLGARAQKTTATLNHVALYVKDLAKSTGFYRDLIEIDTIPEPFHDGRHTWFKVAEHVQLHLIQGSNIVTPDINTHLCFSIRSMDKFIARLDKLNINYRNWKGDARAPTVRVDGVKQVYLQDPNGYWVEVNDDKY